MRRISLALVASLALAVTFAGSASAYTLVSQNGTVGTWSFADGSTVETAPVHCSYGPNVYSNWVYFKKMTVQPPTAKAFNRTAKRDHQYVSWQFTIQKKKIDTPTVHHWVTLKSSALQKKLAYDNQKAAFTPLIVKFNAELKDPEHNFISFAYRALVTIKWYRADGTVAGRVKLRPTYYSNSSSDNYITPFVASHPWCSAIATTG